MGGLLEYSYFKPAKGKTQVQSLNHIIKDNVNNVNKTNLNNVNNVSNVKKKQYAYNIKEVRERAETIASRLNDPSSLNFYYKVCWQLPENVIWNNLEQAQGGKNPRAYFTFLCKLSMN